jgi:general secretion pathway protein A
MRGYRRYPWGGVESGGVLFGTRDETGIQIYSHRLIECEHEFGPAFELSDKDLPGLERMLAKAVPEEEQRGYVLLGWYHSVSSRDLGLTLEARRFHERFLPEDWQVCMVLRRSKQDPLGVSFFLPNSSGTLESISQPREFAIENFKIRESDFPNVDPPSTPPAPSAPPVDRTDSGLAPVVVMPSPVHATPAPVPLASPEAEAPPSDVGNQRPPETKPAPPDNSSDARPWAVPAAARIPSEYFGFARDPFSQTPDPRFFYAAPGPREALAILLHGIQRRGGFSALIGETGVGKSLVLECLIEELRAEGVHFAYLFSSKVNSEQFFELLANDLDLSCASARKSSILIALNEHLVRQCQAGQTTALIIDNAQKLQPEVLEEIELLGNLENRSGKLLQVVFAGQPSFEFRLERPELRGLRQRLLLRARLGPLSEDHTAAYVSSRLTVAGGSVEIFPPEVLSEVYRRTGGVPRLINEVCAGLLKHCMEARVVAADLAMLETVCAALDLFRYGARHEDQDPDTAVSA